MKLGKAVAENNGYAIHELFVLDAYGKYVFTGYGVLSPEGKLIQSFSALEAAQEYLGDVASQLSTASSWKP